MSNAFRKKKDAFIWPFTKSTVIAASNSHSAAPLLIVRERFALKSGIPINIIYLIVKKNSTRRSKISRYFSTFQLPEVIPVRYSTSYLYTTCIIDTVSIKNEFWLIMVVGRSARTISRQEALVLMYPRAIRIRNLSKNSLLPYAPNLLMGLIINHLSVVLSRANVGDKKIPF